MTSDHVEMSSKKSSSRSFIWNYFQKTSDPEVVTCKICEAPVKPCGNTTNVRNHMKRNHASVKIGEGAGAAAAKVRRTSISSTQSLAKLVQLKMKILTIQLQI